MSVLLRSSILRQSAAASRQPGRWLSTATKHENNPEDKQSTLEWHGNGKGKGKEEKTPGAGWSEELASDAEAFVKANREEIDASDDSIAKLDEEAKKLLQAKGIKH